MAYYCFYPPQNGFIISGGGDCPAPPPCPDEQTDGCRISLASQGIFPQQVLKAEARASLSIPQDEDAPMSLKERPTIRPTIRGTIREHFWRPGPLVMPKVPSLVISEDDTGPFVSNTSHSNLDLCDGKVVREGLWMADSRYYNQNRGPILRVVGSKTEVLLTYKEFMQLDPLGMPMDEQHEDFTHFHPEVEDLFVCDDMEQFSATRLCKQVKMVVVKNEGSTAVRYQWLRSPPTRAMRKILGRPGCILNLKKLQQPGKDPFFWKDTAFEFHFRELPGIILPGQCAEFPIIFRPQRNGYFHEHIYLLTHPRLSNENDEVFKIRLSGISMDPDCITIPEGAETKTCKGISRILPDVTVDKLKRHLESKMKRHEAQDAVNAILDAILYSHKQPKNTLPNGKVTQEKIFYAHNPKLIYRHGVAEKALEDVRKLATRLVPKERILDNEDVCPLSITKMYLEVARQPPPDGYFRANVKTAETEHLLSEFADCTRKLHKPRVFGWPSVDSILYSSCYNTMVSMMDDIMFRIANIDMDSKNKELNHVLRNEAREKLRKRKMQELGMKVRLSDAQQSGDDDGARDSDFFLFKDELNRDSAVGDMLWTARSSAMPESAGRLAAPVDPLFPRVATVEGGTSLENEYGDEEDLSLDEVSTEYVGEDGEFPRKSVIEIDEEELDAEMQRMKHSKETQCRRILFETLFGCGLERMMSVVDAHRAMIPYTESDAIRRFDGTCSKH